VKTISLVLGAAFCFLLTLAPHSSARDIDAFFSSRQVLGTIYFPEGSTDLDKQGEAQILALLPRLRNLDPALKLVRVEGFSAVAGKDADGVTQAMLRAQAVWNFLHAKGAGTERYTLNGQLSGRGAGSQPPPDRAEIVVYDNLLDIHPVEVDQLIKR